MTPADDKRHDRPDPEERVKIAVSTADRPDFDEPLVAFAFDANGTLVDRAEVSGGALTLNLSEDDAARAQVFVVPATEELAAIDPTPALLKRLGAFEPILRAGHRASLVGQIAVPGFVIDGWPFCRCLVRGRVVRSSDDLPICNARVHICEVDEFSLVLEQLSDLQIGKLRDDLVHVDRNPPIGDPDPGPLRRSLLRLESPAPAPQGPAVAANLLPAELVSKLHSRSTQVVRDALVTNARLVYPFLCYWRHWWWLLQVDEVAVRTTDAAGRFSASIPYFCAGDHPDIYLWVEYDLGNGYETVYRPSAGCWTYWEYACGSQKTIRVSDPRVPACYPEPELGGRQVQIVSIGRTVGIGEIHTSGPTEGMVTEDGEDYGFGGSLEPRVWASNKALIDSGITHYLWSKKGPSDPDWVPLQREVVRHYATTTNLSGVESMKELAGPNAGHFRIRPKDPPTGGIDWEVADEREDLAWAHFDTARPGIDPDPIPDCGIADAAAGKYQLKFELFDSAGQRIVWDTAPGGPITLRHSTNEAPFGTSPVSFAVANDYHRIKDADGNTVAFRMVLHVDNSKSAAEILPIPATAGLTVEEACGVITHAGPSTPVQVGFRAGRPNGLARFTFSTTRGLSTAVAKATTGGDVDAVIAGNFSRSGCEFTSNGLQVHDFLSPPGETSCAQGAFIESVRVTALTTDGYLTGWLDAHDDAAFMLTTPCPECESD